MKNSCQLPVVSCQFPARSPQNLPVLTTGVILSGFSGVGSRAHYGTLVSLKRYPVPAAPAARLQALKLSSAIHQPETPDIHLAAAPSCCPPNESSYPPPPARPPKPAFPGAAVST